MEISDWKATAYPVVFWNIMSEQGHPVRATVSEMGPLLLSRILNLNGTQEGVLNIVFKVADDNGLLLLDLKDKEMTVDKPCLLLKKGNSAWLQLRTPHHTALIGHLRRI